MSEKMQLGFYLDIGACIGCKACQTACKDKNDLPVDINWRKVIEYNGGSWQVEKDDIVPVDVFAYYLTVSCQHCENPPCLPVCPTAAVSKAEDGIVHIDPAKCMGCQYCLWACPYGAPQFGGRGEPMSKCDMCTDLRAIDTNPACVDACPLRALDWGDMAEIRKKHGNLNAVDPLPDGGVTNPSMILTPHRHTQSLSNGAGHSAILPDSDPKGKNAIGPNTVKESK